MSQQYPDPGQPMPDGNQPYYYSPPVESRPMRLLRLARIFNLISASLDLLLMLLLGAAGTFFLVMGSEMPHNASDPPPQVLGGIYLAMGVLALPLAIVKFIGNSRLSRGGPGAWGWGLTIAIIGMAQMLCGNCCMLQPAAGVYTLVILCFQDVKDYLARGTQDPASGNPYGSPHP